MLLLVALTAGFIRTSVALTCYEHDSEGNMQEVKNDQWTYCVLIPETEKSEAKLFGIGPGEETLTGYDHTFQQSDNLYKVLTVCIYEKYELGKISPRFGRSEFLFRCVCNYDRCNSHQTFQGYLRSVQRDNEP
ncbi:hypothetical protein OESDEN_03254 [Oesophagostomum dentatum]|uniref:Transthyretin-like family protein n=1 Tax=Oesophagostomum dentatum TaxID=61180 RepID=A0A0B1TGV8_OESDE|nr:hypothetical protein OESDEN_03254 [Oesophagostomum dentatum]